jgi:hypothetical protein
MHRFASALRIGSVNMLPVLVTAIILSMAACVAPIAIKDQAPKLSYAVNEKVGLALVDDRRELTVDKKPPTFIGRIHVMFGIPMDMQVYPWVALKVERGFTLAQELEQRIADGLQSRGATVVRIPAGVHVDAASAKFAAQDSGANRLLLISLDEWYIDMNANWVGSFEFDWGYTVDICDGAGVEIATFKDSGQEDIKEKASDSARNMITVAYRTRIEKLLARPEIRAALSESTKQ